MHLHTVSLGSSFAPRTAQGRGGSTVPGQTIFYSLHGWSGGCRELLALALLLLLGRFNQRNAHPCSPSFRKVPSDSSVSQGAA